MTLRQREMDRATGGALECPYLPSMESANHLAFADLSNVVFLRRHHGHATQGDAPPCIVDAESRPAPLPPHPASRRFVAAVVATIVLHGAALAAFLYEPAPLPSIGVEAISIEIVIGADALAGQQQTPSPMETDQAEVQAEEKPVEPVTEPIENADAKIADKNMELAAVQPTPEETKPTPEPQAVELPKPEEVKPVETKVEPIAEPKIEKPADKPTPVTRAEPKQAKKKSDRDTERTRRRVAAASPQQAQVSSNSVGIGRSSTDINYRNLVRGHLMRFKPAFETGGGTSQIRFSFSPSGAVTSVSLVASSGNPKLDEMALAMVRRASPFPAPPDGRPQTFPIPINWVR